MAPPEVKGAVHCPPCIGIWCAVGAGCIASEIEHIRGDPAALRVLIYIGTLFISISSKVIIYMTPLPGVLLIFAALILPSINFSIPLEMSNIQKSLFHLIQRHKYRCLFSSTSIIHTISSDVQYSEILI